MEIHKIFTIDHLLCSQQVQYIQNLVLPKYEQWRVIMSVNYTLTCITRYSQERLKNK